MGYLKRIAIIGAVLAALFTVFSAPAEAAVAQAPHQTFGAVNAQSAMDRAYLGLFRDGGPNRPNDVQGPWSEDAARSLQQCEYSSVGKWCGWDTQNFQLNPLVETSTNVVLNQCKRLTSTQSNRISSLWNRDIQSSSGEILAVYAYGNCTVLILALGPNGSAGVMTTGGNNNIESWRMV